MKPRILVPVDGSDYSIRALDIAIRLAGSLDAEIVVCHVVDLAKAATMSSGEAQLAAGALDILETEGQRIVDDAVERAVPSVATSSRIVQGEPIGEIDRLANELQPLFIVIGTHGRTGLSRLVMGSVAEGVVRRAPVPVMIVPPEHAHASAAPAADHHFRIL